jgi:excisionase family DNA binding protein
MGLQSDLPERYRRADLRLRQLLLGDGSETPGVVKGDEARQRVTAELRHMRDAFAESIEREEDESSAARAEERVAELEEELRQIAAAHARREPREPLAALMTAAQAAQALGVSTSSVYRAVRRGDVRAVRPTGLGGRALRIPRSEVDRLLERASGAGADIAAVSPGSRSDLLRREA